MRTGRWTRARASGDDSALTPCMTAYPADGDVGTVVPAKRSSPIGGGMPCAHSACLCPAAAAPAL